jgi:serine/threonine protein phosphatase PrpC
VVGICAAEPDIRIFDVTDKDLYFILACDGIWDVLSDQQVVDIANSSIGNLAEVASAVNRTAFQKNSDDNLTCTVVAFLNNSSQAELLLKDSKSEMKDLSSFDMFAD